VSVSPLRRFALLTVLAVVSFQCAPVRKPQFDRERDHFCTSGNYSKSHPMICVDDATLAADPDSAHVFNVQPDANNHPSNKPVVIHWFAQHGGDIQIKFLNTSCVDQLHCEGGHCVAVVRTQSSHTTCKYEISIGDMKKDPDIVVDPCCW